MTPNLVLCVLAGVLAAVGVYLLLERSLSRALLGLILFGNGANLLFLVASGRAGQAAIVGRTAVEAMSDPLPQAMVLTAIVITLGMTAFILAMAHRSWQLARTDDVADDAEDTRIHDLAEHNDMSASDFAEGTRDDTPDHGPEARS
jgi:multicomponent Na+:H+ antiporter subunit C